MLVLEHAPGGSLVHLRHLKPPARMTFAVDTGPGGEALARAICSDLLGNRWVTQDPGLYLEFLFGTVAHLDRRAWVLSETQIREALAVA
ncbi:MAG: hypothetical protein M3336_02485 [Chloroflexota bacterium]|nr:hypothetical protein [Chloroflexota bacterium]